MAYKFLGHCQICDRLHKASEVSIAAHGYTIANGWQEHTCYGSRGGPIETSCDLIESAIKSAHAYIKRAEIEIAERSKNPLGASGTIPVRIYRTTRAGNEVSTISCTVRLNDDNIPVAVDGSGAVIKTWPFYKGATVESATAELVKNRLDFLRSSIEAAKMDIEFLSKRLANWEPKPLKPVSAADLAKSAPKVHFAAKVFKYEATLCCSSVRAAQRLGNSIRTDNPEEVTCSGCLKKLAARAAKAK